MMARQYHRAVTRYEPTSQPIALATFLPLEWRALFTAHIALGHKAFTISDSSASSDSKTIRRLPCGGSRHGDYVGSNGDGTQGF